jgi:SPP1 gp7 family putative phage head morphogenesis protein
MTADRRPGRVPQEVLDFFAAKGIKPAFDSRDVWREEHLAAFSVAKAVEADVIESLRKAVAEALAEGLPFEEFRKRITPILADLGWWGRKDATDPITGETKEVQLGSPRRLKLILETNARVARAAGQWERMQQSKAALPFLRYRLGASEKHRPEHEKWDGKIFRIDDPFWDYWYPSNGYNCKCWVEQISAHRAKQLGGESESPKLEFAEFVNPRTGRRITSPVGIDPTFAFNPGKDRLAGLKMAGILPEE